MRENHPNKRLWHERELKGWSRRKLAELLETNEQVVYRWEKGKHIPSRHFQELLCTLFGKNGEELGFLDASLTTEEEAPNTRQSFTSPSTPILLASQRHDLPPDFSQDVMETIRELERTADNLRVSDIAKRRAVIAHLLGIPPTLFSSDRYAVSNVTDAMKLQEETLSALYEDLLIMGWDSFRRSKSPHIITKIDEHVAKLTALTCSASIGDEAHWQSLLCRFSQLSTRVAQHRLDEPRALQMAKQAIMIAIDLDDTELIASTFYQRHIVHMELSNIATSEAQKRQHVILAKTDIDAALGYAEQVRPPLAGNIYLTAAEVYAHMAGSDASLRMQCEKWQDKTAALVDERNIEDDGTFLKLNSTALHHERAKTLLRFGKIEEAHRELDTAWQTLQPNFFTWHMNIHLTEATLFIAKFDIEGSVKSGIQAYNLAKAIHSHKGETEAKCLLVELQKLDSTNSYIRGFEKVVYGEA